MAHQPSIGKQIKIGAEVTLTIWKLSLSTNGKLPSTAAHSVCCLWYVIFISNHSTLKREDVKASSFYFFISILLCTSQSSINMIFKRKETQQVIKLGSCYFEVSGEVFLKSHSIQFNLMRERESLEKTPQHNLSSQLHLRDFNAIKTQLQ